jgi:DNA-binding NarL/FixJ family response regulator
MVRSDMRIRPGAEALPAAGLDVLIVEPHEPARLGYSVLLRREPWVRRCLAAGTAERAVGLLRLLPADAALVDVTASGPFVARLCDDLRAARPSLRIVLTSRVASDAIRRRRPAGVASFLPPGATALETIAAIRAAALDQPAPYVAPSADGLTRREREVLQLLATGATNPQIAAELHLSRDAVKKHASSLYRKLGVSNRTQASQRAAAVLVRMR